jgi:hypothetical protein
MNTVKPLIAGVIIGIIAYDLGYTDLTQHQLWVFIIGMNILFNMNNN